MSANKMGAYPVDSKTPEMDYDFSKPQRQSASGVIVMFFNTFQQIARALAIPIFVFIIKFDDINTSYVLLGIGVFTLFIAVFAYLRYKKFTFYLNDEQQEFVINEGVLNKTNLTIQLDKIQQVNINQSVLQRLIGVYSLDIDTAGSDKKEASIKAIDKKIAEGLKQRLLNRDAEYISEGLPGKDLSGQDLLSKADLPGKTDQDIPFLRLSSATLLKIGITSNYGQTIALVIGFFAAAFEGLKDLNKVFFEIDQDQVGTALKEGFNLLSLCILIAFILLFLLAVNVARTFLKYYDFGIVRQKLSLAITSGLFAKKNTLLNPHKVQISAYSQNYFQRKMNILDMRMKQNAAAAYDGNEIKKNDIEIPGCSERERDEILKMIFNQLPEKGKIIRPNFRFLFFGIITGMILPVLLFLIAGEYFYAGIQFYYPVIAPYLIISAVMLYFGFKNHQLYTSENFIIKKQGIWDVEHLIIEPHKIQALSTSQKLWHKKVDIGHVICHTAAGNVVFKFGNFTAIKQLVNYWLYQVETSKKSWM